MLMLGLARLGNEPEVRYTPDGKALMDLSLAFSYGRKVDGKQPTQWVTGTMWGERCEKLRPHLAKGQLLFVSMTEPHVETFKRKDGSEGVTMRARVGELEFAGPKPDSQPETPQNAGKYPSRSSLGSIDDDIPF
jgi:single-strand DNA-binding protein